MKIDKFRVIFPVCFLFLTGTVSLAVISADDAGMEKKGRSDTQLTADQQAANGADADITRKIHDDLAANKDLSIDARNVKITTSNGHVTLKGPVQSKAEENAILMCARSAMGVHRVTDKMKVAQAK